MSQVTLEELHRMVIVHLAAASGNLRMLAVGAPFASQLVENADRDVKAALAAAQEAEAIRAEVSRRLQRPIDLTGEVA